MHIFRAKEIAHLTNKWATQFLLQSKSRDKIQADLVVFWRQVCKPFGNILNRVFIIAVDEAV